MSLKDLARLTRTVAHLRPSQIYWRGRYALRRHVPFQAIRESTTPPKLGHVGAPITGVISLIGFGLLVKRRVAVEERALGRS